MTESRNTARPGRRTGAAPAPAPHTEPAAASGTGPVSQVPAYAAGSGMAALVLDAAIGAGFRPGSDEDANEWATSPDGRVRIEFGPETSRYRGNPLGGLWLITYQDPEQPAQGWRAQFGDQVPAEAITAFVMALLVPGGLDAERADLDETDTRVTVQIAISPKPQPEAEAKGQAEPADNHAPAQAATA